MKTTFVLNRVLFSFEHPLGIIQSIISGDIRTAGTVKISYLPKSLSDRVVVEKLVIGFPLRDIPYPGEKAVIRSGQIVSRVSVCSLIPSAFESSSQT